MRAKSNQLWVVETVQWSDREEWHWVAHAGHHNKKFMESRKRDYLDCASDTCGKPKVRVVLYRRVEPGDSK